MADIKIFNPDGLARPAGTYTHVASAKTQQVVFIAGQVAMNAAGAVVGKDDFEAQYLTYLDEVVKTIRTRVLDVF